MKNNNISYAQTNQNRRRMILCVIMALCAFVASTFATYAFCKYFLTKHAETQKLVQATATNSTPEQKQAAEGTDESQIKQDTIDSYKVAPDQPRIITIDSIGVRARILPMGLNPDKSVQAPTNIHDTGWYTNSVKPGQVGTALIDGHDVGATSNGVFVKLGQLKSGDTVDIEMGDGTKHTYAVKSSETKPLDQVDMADVLGLNNNDGKAHLSIITCTGKVVKQGKRVTQDHRIIVKAELIK